MKAKKKITDFARLKETESSATGGERYCNVKTYGFKELGQCWVSYTFTCVMNPQDSVMDGPGGGGGGGIPAIPHPTPDPDF